VKWVESREAFYPQLLVDNSSGKRSSSELAMFICISIAVAFSPGATVLIDNELLCNLQVGHV
jgi:hypothetical protein